MKTIAAIQTVGVLLMVAAVGVGAFMLYRFLNSGAANIGQKLKDSPLGIPSRAIDAGITAATGREETLGGFLADLFDPTTRRANAELTATRRIKPVDALPESDGTTGQGFVL